MITGPIIAEIAALVGDPTRATMVSALLDGGALTASELARAAHITPQTASSHLAKLTAAGLLSMIRRGRQRHFRLASPTVVDMLDGIVAVALLTRPRHRPLSREARALGAGRICYDHLAGRLSVELTDALVAREYLVRHDAEAAEITTAGARFLTAFGVALSGPGTAHRYYCRLCLDWTERRPHIAGAIAAALTRRYFDLGWMERMRDSQAVVVTPRGRRGFWKTFGIDASGPGDGGGEESTLRSRSNDAGHARPLRM
jgi:DNA-binding transcriptional ArsR family regulator